jgi:PleD family two-component response regulator
MGAASRVGELEAARKHNHRIFEKEKAMTALRKVLVVDDDPVVRKSFDRVLSSKGYAVITAGNGEEALRKLNEEKYDVV